MGNEYHSICCGLSGIMFAIKLVEGKDKPRMKPTDLTNTHGKTVGLLLCLCKPLFRRGTIVIIDSGFYVLKGIIELRKNGVFSSALIKKQKYWPRYIDSSDAVD